MSRKSDRDEFKQIEDLLISTDVESSKYEELIFNRLKYKIETGTIKSNEIEKEDRDMKKKSFKPSKVVTLTLATLICGVTVTYGSEILSSIIARFQVGNTEITQYESNREEESLNATKDAITREEMQEGFKGKLFDKDGNEALYGEHQDYYTADGKWIASMMVKELPNGGYEFIASTEDGVISDEKVFTLEEVKEVAHKDIELPTYLPQGYNFKEATTSFEGAGVNAIYENQAGDTIVLLASATKEATNGVATTDGVTETTIAGQKITLSTNCAFWESKAVGYQMYWNFENSVTGEIPFMDMKEVAKIIESMK